MDTYQLSERDICTKFITPAIQQAGWQQHQFREEVKLTDGRVIEAEAPLGLLTKDRPCHATPRRPTAPLRRTTRRPPRSGVRGG